jgi:transposase
LKELDIPPVDIFVPDTPPVSPKTKEISTQTDEVECLTCEGVALCYASCGGVASCASKRKSDDPDYWKNYYEANKERLKEQKKKWREANKDKVNNEKKKEYQKKYDAKNKDKIKARRERLVVCECGEEMKAFSLRKHKTSKIHKLRVELKIAKGIVIVETPVEEEDDNSSTSSTLSS